MILQFPPDLVGYSHKFCTIDAPIDARMRQNTKRRQAMREFAAIFLAAVAGWAQSSQPNGFEVASVKPAGGPDRQPAICLVPCAPGGRLTVEHLRVDIRYSRWKASLRQRTASSSTSCRHPT